MKTKTPPRAELPLFDAFQTLIEGIYRTPARAPTPGHARPRTLDAHAHARPRAHVHARVRARAV